jgi:hypothetical protein
MWRQPPRLSNERSETPRNTQRSAKEIAQLMLRDKISMLEL